MQTTAVRTVYLDSEARYILCLNGTQYGTQDNTVLTLAHMIYADAEPAMRRVILHPYMSLR